MEESLELIKQSPYETVYLTSLGKQVEDEVFRQFNPAARDYNAKSVINDNEALSLGFAAVRILREAPWAEQDDSLKLKLFGEIEHLRHQFHCGYTPWTLDGWLAFSPQRREKALSIADAIIKLIKQSQI
jgi:hypothetical protein